MNDRIALVIGNANYKKVGKLNNPLNDANDIECVLSKLNFDVTKVTDANLFELQKAINTFLKKMDDYAVGLFYYSGHGMQIDGKNYILPVDLESCGKSKTIVSCYCFNSFLDGVSSYKGKTIICILDACRNNPFTSSGRGFTNGFATISHAPKGVIIAYSTSTDCTASDGKGNNGLYTQVLKEALLIPNLKIEEMFKSVRIKVSEISTNQYGEDQLSWEYSSLVGDFYFSVISQPVNENVSDETIHRFICDQRKHYEKITDNIYDIECMPYVDAYNRFHIPIIKVLRAYSRIDNKMKGIHFTDATLDQLNGEYLTSWGFIQKNMRWYYNKRYVEMGDLLPLPDELKPLEPVNGHELKIEIVLHTEYVDGKLRFNATTNIPEGTPIIFTLKGRKYIAQCRTEKKGGELLSDWFSNGGEPLSNGFYTIELSCPIDKVLPDCIKKIFGVRNRNITGKHIKFDPIGGNTIHFLSGVLINSSLVQIIDMQKEISTI